MERLKAQVQYVDTFGRVSIITETNQALLLFCPNPEAYLKGDEIYLEREDGFRRATDWKMGGLVNVLR